MSDEGNGILGELRGEWIAAAARLLPAPETATEERMSSVIDEPFAGRVRVVHERVLIRRGKHRHWSWIPLRADREV